MKKHIVILLAVALGAGLSTMAATNYWTGAGNGISLFETNNWDMGVDLGISNFKNVPVPHDFIVDDGAATVGGAGGVGGTLDLGGTGTLAVSNGTIRLGAGAVIKDGSAWVSGASSFGYIQGTLNNADFVCGWGLSLAGPMHLINGSTVEATWFAGGGTNSLDGASTLTIREDESGTYSGGMVDFLDTNSQIVYSNPGRTISEVINQHLSRFLVNGTAAVLGENIKVFTDSGTGFTTVQAISTPISFTWSGAGDGESLFATNNWASTVNLGTGNFDNVPVPYYFTVTNGTPGGTDGWAGTLDLGGTGMLTVSDSAGFFRMSTNATIKNGTVTFPNVGGDRDIRGTLDNVDFYTGGGSGLAGSLDLINGSTYDTVWFAFGGDCSLDGASTLIIREDGSGTFNGTTVDFLDFDSKIVYSNTGRTIEEVVSQHLSKFTVNGAAAALNINITVFADPETGFTTVQALSEPVAFLWTGAGDGVSLFATNNWSDYVDLGTANFENVPVPYDFIVTNGTPGGAGFSGTLDLATNGSLTVSAGTFKMGSAAVIKDGSVSISGNQFGRLQGTLDHVDFYVGGGSSLAGSMDLLNGTTYDTVWFAFGGVCDMDGASTLQIRENGVGSFNGTTIDFLDFDSKIVYTGGYSVENVISNHLSHFTVTGEVAVVDVNISIYADESTGLTTVQALQQFTEYEAWALSYGLTNGMDALDYDVEPDGLDNLMEYALGGDPTVADAATVLPVYWAENDGSSNWFYYVHNKRSDPSLTYTVKATDSLALPAWDTNGVVIVGESAEVDGYSTVTNRTDVDAAEFLNLEVSK